MVLPFQTVTGYLEIHRQEEPARRKGPTERALGNCKVLLFSIEDNRLLLLMGLLMFISPDEEETCLV